jgi:hypothetical protein
VRIGLVALILAVGVLVVLPVGSYGGTGRASSGLRVAAGDTNLSLSLSGSTFPLSPLFWGSTVSARARFLPSETDMLNSTPARVLVWPGGAAGDDFDPFTGMIYNTRNGTGTHAPTNESEFVDLCRAVACTAIVQLPGEIDNVTIAQQVVDYTQDTLGFTPAYYEIGNEPALWRHWQVPWTSWVGGTSPAPNATQYAQEVNAYIPAIRATGSTVPIIGLPGIGTAGVTYGSWVRATVALNGPNLSAVAIHMYPANTQSTSLAQFYASLVGPASLPARVGSVRQTIAETCPTCNISLFVTEIGSALSHRSESIYADQFPGALDMAAQMVQAMDYNLTNLDLYASVFDTANSWFALDGSVRPTYTVYSSILNHLGPVVDPVGLTLPNGSAPDGSYFSVATIDPSDQDRADLLVVNTNLSQTISFTPALPGVASSTPAEAWTWENNSTSAPVGSFESAGLPGSFSLPPQSLALFESYPNGGGSSLQINETGLVNGTRWYVHVGPSEYTSDLPGQTLFLPNGTYPVLAPSLPAPSTLPDFHRGRIEPFGPTSVAVGTSPASLSLTYHAQWEVALSASPGGTGSISPAPAWANASEPLELTAIPAPGFAFDRWFGLGPGAVTNSTDDVATVVPTGPITEKAIFQPGVSLSFAESGLPAGTPWSVVFRGSNYTSTDPTITIGALPGTFGFHISTDSAYRSDPPGGSVVVGSSPVQVPVTFLPPRMYRVVFTEKGLRDNATWWISFGSSSFNGSSGRATVHQPGGPAKFQVHDSGGFIPHPASGTVDFDSANQSILITFLPQLYAVEFSVSGLPARANWTVRCSNQTEANLTGTLTNFSVQNGTYTFDVVAPHGYRAIPSHGNLTVDAKDQVVSVQLLFDGPGSIPSTWHLAIEAGTVATFIGVAGWIVWLLLGAAGRRGRSPRD